MSRINKLTKVIKNHKASKSASSKYLGRRLGDRPLLPSSIANVATGTFAGLMFVLSFVALASGNDASAADSLTITISNNGLVDMNITNTNANGTFAKSNSQTVSVKTTNATGYTLKIAASNEDDSKKLINSEDSGTYLTSVTEATAESEFKKLTNIGYNGKWGYLPSKLNSTANTDFLPAPTTTGDTIDETTTANPTTANEYSLAIGARIDSSQKLGSYSNTYVFYADANAVPYSIIYDDNVVSNMPTDVNDGQAVGGKFNLSDSTPTRAGYAFMGWCTVQPTASGDADTCSGTTYQPNAGITISSATSYHLYAMWKKEATMQTWSSCSTLSVGDTVTLKDGRDGESYLIGKLKDNKCWMLDNLRLGSTSAIALTPADTNITSNWTLPAGITSGFNSYTDAQINVASKDNTTTNYGAGSGKIGVYYNYCAASGGTYCMASGSGTGNAEHDICPAGWRMPTGGGSGEYKTLYAAYGSNAADFRNALSTPLSGFFNGSSANNQGSYGYFWSSTRNDGNYVYGLVVGSSSVFPEYDGSRGSGNSVRCVAQ